MTQIALWLEAVSIRIGVAVAWLGIPLIILLAALEPLVRWIGWAGDAPLSEASTAAFFALIMSSFGYAYAAGGHVRLDILSRRFPRRANAAIELGGTLLILLPLCTVMVIDGTESAWRSLQLGERWADTGWALQWMVRVWVPVGFLLLMFAAISSALRAMLSLSGK